MSVNSVRLDDAGLKQLDALGRVSDIIRIAGNHGMDDPFYKDRDGAKVWVVRGQRYIAGFHASAPQTYFTGPAWFKNCQPPAEQLRGIRKIGFSHVMPSHGFPMLGNARAKFRPAIERLT